MAQSSSMMLVEMNAGEIEAQLHVNPVDFENYIDASSFMYGQVWHEFLQIHVQSSSEILHDHDSNKRKCFCVRKLQVLDERKFWLILRSGSENCC